MTQLNVGKSAGLGAWRRRRLCAGLKAFALFGLCLVGAASA
jgi:hypothetical protein